jgi:hypothetical protein
MISLPYVCCLQPPLWGLCRASFVAVRLLCACSFVVVILCVGPSYLCNMLNLVPWRLWPLSGVIFCVYG